MAFEIKGKGKVTIFKKGGDIALDWKPQNGAKLVVNGTVASNGRHDSKSTTKKLREVNADDLDDMILMGSFSMTERQFLRRLQKTYDSGFCTAKQLVSACPNASLSGVSSIILKIKDKLAETPWTIIGGKSTKHDYGLRKKSS